MPIETRYCRRCRCDTLPDAHNHCPWCDRWLGKARRSTAGIPKHMTEQQLVAAYELYRQGESALVIARRLLPETTYKTAQSLDASLRYQWKERGWPIRTQGQAQTIAWARDPKRRDERRASLRKYHAEWLASRVPEKEVARAEADHSGRDPGRVGARRQRPGSRKSDQGEASDPPAVPTPLPAGLVGSVV